MKSDINEFNDKRNNLLVNTVDFQEKYDRSKRKRDDILDKVEDLLDKIQENHQKEREIESEFPVIDVKQRRQFQYSKYRTEVLHNSCNKDNLTLTKVLSSMPLYKQERIYEIKKQGIKEFAEKKFNKLKPRIANKTLSPMKRRETALLDQKNFADLRASPQQHSSPSSDDDYQALAGLRMRSPDEALTYLKDNFGVVMRPPQKYKLRTRKEIEQEEKLMERERRKVYNVKDKLDLYYSTLEGPLPLTSRKRLDDPISLLNNSTFFGDPRSGDVSPMIDKDMKNSIFNRNQYYTDHYSSIKIGVGKEMKQSSRNLKSFQKSFENE